MIGRINELELLKNDFIAPTSSILVFYGRRRIGKSYLIENYLQQLKNKQKTIPSFFQFEGIEGQSTSFQIKSFYKKLVETFSLDRQALTTPRTWQDTLQLL